ncbi:MAG: DUF5666 domain-containing protein [Candidatus Jorgensenbacteria bacterium]
MKNSAKGGSAVRLSGFGKLTALSSPKSSPSKSSGGKNKTMKKIIVLAIVGVVVIGGVSFYGGMRYGKSSAQPAQGMGRFGNLPAGQQRTDQRGAFAGGGGTSGEIVSADNQSITLKLREGSSKIVFFSSSTKIMKSTDGARSDLTSGVQVVVSGTANPDGSITAQTIQLRTGMLAQ